LQARKTGHKASWQWLLARQQTLSDMDRFYRILSDNCATGRFCALSDLDSKKALFTGPGIYFFFEKGERRSNGSQNRVVRVGITQKNHRSLYNRLNDHRTAAAVSIFTTLVYGAMAYDQGLHTRLQASFGVGPQDFHEYLYLGYPQIRARAGRLVENAMRDFEQSIVLPHMNRGNFSVTWVEVSDTALRVNLENCAVSLLSNHHRGAAAIDPPTPVWLGRHSHKPEVQKSGLWNQDYVLICYSSVTPGWLDSLERLI
jgi:hypothetical protein